jgi:hypothetical protein
MAFIDTAEIGKTYTFDTKSPYLGSKVTNAKLQAILNYEVARKYSNIDLTYRIVHPTLPPGTPDSVETSQYFLFRSESGEDLVMADIWIQDSTVDEVGHISFKVTVEKASIADIEVVRSAMVSLGYIDFSITQLS